MKETDLSLLKQRLTSLEDENDRLRTALAETEARVAHGGHEFLLRDAICLTEERLRCRHEVVRGRVSVVIPAYNAQNFIERAVRSVWAQRFPSDRIEVLVVDDGSKDDTTSIVERLVASSPMAMRILRHEGGKNRGVAPSRQLAASEATGEFIALLDADDVFLPDRLRVSVKALAADRTLAAVCSYGRNVNDKGKPIIGHNGSKRAGEWRALGEHLQAPFTFEQLWKETPIANSTLTIRRSALERVGGFPTLMAHQAEDWLLVLKLSLLASIPCIEKELILYSHHGEAYTHAYHSSGWRDGARLELFYHIAWWMLSSPGFAEAGSRFFRREYPRQVAEHQRFFPLLRDYYAAGGRPPGGATAIGDHIQRLDAELDTLRRVTRNKLRENKELRQLVSGLSAGLAQPATMKRAINA